MVARKKIFSKEQEQIRVGLKKREAENILPVLSEALKAHGSLHLDTDRISLGAPAERSVLTFLADTTAEFVISERDGWAEQVEALEKESEYLVGLRDDYVPLLNRLRELDKAEGELDVEAVRGVIRQYQTPFEKFAAEHYPRMFTTINASNSEVSDV
jgi:hypothetical protein